MKNLSTDTHVHDASADKELYDLLSKSASDESPGDTGETTVGVNPDLYPDPEDRPAGNMDARWGESDGKDGQTPLHYSKETLRQFKEGREKMLASLFDNKNSSDSTDQKLLGQQLSHAASGDFETSSPQLASKTDMAIHKTSSIPETLADQVRRITGRV